MQLVESSKRTAEVIRMPGGPAIPEWRPTLLLACGYPLLSHALRHLMERGGCKVAGESSNHSETIRFATVLQPDAVVLDFDGALDDGMAAARAIMAASPNSRIIVLTTRIEEERALQALRLGIHGYTLKTKQPSELVEAIQEVANGGSYFCPELSRLISINHQGTRRLKGVLTDREREVVRLIADGHSTKQVAAELGISTKTADSHRTKIMDKLNIHETASLVRFAVRQGLVQP